jgi:ElaB/YqjD/DUF883 family membrane-anchored ribosome-binding protein
MSAKLALFFANLDFWRSKRDSAVTYCNLLSNLEETPMDENKTPKQAADSAKEHVRAAADDFKTAATAKADEIRRAAEKKAEELRIAAQGKAKEFRGAAESAWSDARTRAKTWQSESETYIRENPAKAVLIALGVGFVLGLLFRK